MRPARWPGDLLRHLHAILGTAGLMIGLSALLSFAFGLLILAREYNRPRETAREVLRREVGAWVRGLPVDALGLTLADYVGQWQRTGPDDRPARLEALRRALTGLGATFDRQGDSEALIMIVGLDLTPKDGPPLASWRSRGRYPTGAGVVNRIPIGLDDARPPVEMTLWYRASPEVEQAARNLEASYRRLLLALLGLSGYSLLGLGYTALHARTLRDRAARESAQQATLDLADRTCHELGNVVFVLANERRNLADHLDLVERFARQEAEVRLTAAHRAGLNPSQAARLDRALEREYAERGVESPSELLDSAALARDVARQIAVCSEYIALTVRELDGHLKRSALPVSPEPLAVSEGLADALALLGPRLEAAGARVERPAGVSANLRVLADRRLLVHALVNLLKNAVEAATAAGLRPEIALSVRPEGPLTWIVVADRGPGIPAAHLTRVFELGFSTKGPGRGRGLAIVRESIRIQKGQLEVSSEPGRGTEVRIGLPSAPPADG